MPASRARTPEPLTDEERATLEAQTQRNLDAMELESAGRVDLAIELYEQNVAEGFPGDWPYGRLVSFYERHGQYDQAERVLNRAIEVTAADRRRPAADRRSILQSLRGRLRVLKKQAQAARKAGPGAGRPRPSFVPLPIVEGG